MESTPILTPREVQKQILIAKTKDPHNYPKIQKLQQLLDKLTSK